MSVADYTSNQQEIKATLQRFKMVMTAYIEESHLKNYLFEIESAFDTDHTILRLLHRPFGEILGSIQYPKNWKEAVKEAVYRWFSFHCKQIYVWFCRKYPVQYTVHNIITYYPDISLPDEKHILTFREVNL
jgi:hypothetical protein